MGDHIFLYNEDGSDATINVTATMSDGTVIDADGNEIDLMEPFASTNTIFNDRYARINA